MDNQFKLGPWLVKPGDCSISNETCNKTIEPKAMSLLVTLAEAEGDLVTRTELFEAIWKDQVVTDYALNTLMANLRKSLTCDQQETQFIETRTKLGYRLTPQIEWLNPIHSNKKNHQQANPMSRFLLAATVVIALSIILLTQFYSQDSNLLNGDRKLKYFSKITDYVINTKHLDNGAPYCINRTHNLVVEFHYLNKNWTMTNDLYEMPLKHKGSSLKGVKEKYSVGFWGEIGKVTSDVDVFFKSEEEYSARSDWKVIDSNNIELCRGYSTISAEKI